MPALSESWNSRAVLQRGRLERNSIDGMGTVRTNWMRRLLPVVGLAVAMSASGLDLTVDGRSDYRIVVDETGVQKVIPIELNDEELTKLKDSANILKDIAKDYI